MNVREKKQFFKFRDWVLEYEYISTDDLWILLMRATQDEAKKFYYLNKRTPARDSTARMKYYRFWIKMLHKSGIIEETKYPMIWKVNQLSSEDVVN